MPQRLAELTSGLNIPTQEALVYLCAREAARQRLFTHIPYLTEMFVSSVEEFAAGLVVDKTEIDDVLRSMDINPDDPMNIQDLTRTTPRIRPDPTHHLQQCRRHQPPGNTAGAH